MKTQNGLYAHLARTKSGTVLNLSNDNIVVIYRVQVSINELSGTSTRDDIHAE